MFTKEEAKREVQKLIEFYNSNKDSFKENSEADIRIKLIDRLFEILGWDVWGRKIGSEVTREETVKMKESKKKKADYTFRLHGIPKFVVEAKAIKNIDLSSDDFREQAVGYAYNLACSWAVLTNFVKTRIYFVDKEDGVVTFNISDISDLESFDRHFEIMWFLSNEAVKNDLLGKYLDDKGIKPQKESVGKQLYDDLREWRSILSGEIKSKYGDYEKYVIEEMVQRIIDRLIFIRKVEDMEIEERKLEQLTRNFKKGEAYKQLKIIFRTYRQKYNSGLFGEKEEHECDRIEIDDRAIAPVVRGMYKPKGRRIEYNFAVIDADVLGNIYEQYLAYILQETRKKAKLEGGRSHRKEQGIYYTPVYIVDYIVKNTVFEALKDRTIDGILSAKILDPACGSGSFLIRAFSEVCRIVEDKLKKGDRSKISPSLKDYSGRLTMKQKITILLSCIYGVDLDKKAVEIAQLNLLFKLLEGETAETISQIEGLRKILPTLNANIKHGNSLIDDNKIVGDDAFKWEEQFSDIMKNGGFDIVVGNPPYVKARDTKNPKSRKFMETCGKFETLYKMWDIYIAFVEKGIKLLKPNGCFAMIIPDTIGEADYTTKLVELILKKYSLYQIDFFPDIEVFSGVGIRNKIIFVKNSTKIRKCKRVLHDLILENAKDLGMADNESPNVFRLTHSKINFDFKSVITLDKICYVSYGARFNSDKYDKMKFKKKELISSIQDKIHNKIYTEGKYINRYSINKEMYVEWGTERCPKRLVRPTFPQLYPPNKLLMSRQKRIATYSDKGHICDNTIIVGVPYNELTGIENKGINKYLQNINLNRKVAEEISKEYDLKYLLAIINSKLIRYFLKANSRSKIDSYPDDWKKIPIKILSSKEQQPIIKLVDKMLSLNKKLSEMKAKTDARSQVEEEIRKTDAEIDGLVYELYGITEEEKKVIEGSLK